MKKVIDADNNTCLEEFEASESEKIKEKYESLGKWDDINFDIDGDLILWVE